MRMGQVAGFFWSNSVNSFVQHVWGTASYPGSRTCHSSLRFRRLGCAAQSLPMGNYRHPEQTQVWGQGRGAAYGRTRPNPQAKEALVQPPPPTRTPANMVSAILVEPMMRATSIISSLSATRRSTDSPG